MKDVLQDLDDRDLLQRISDLDTAADHERARSKHVPTTGEWLLQDDSYISWAHGNERLLWLYGIRMLSPRKYAFEVVKPDIITSWERKDDVKFDGHR